MFFSDHVFIRFHDVQERGAEMLVKSICDLYDKLKVSEEQRLPLAIGHVCPVTELHKSQHLPQLDCLLQQSSLADEQEIATGIRRQLRFYSHSLIV